MSVCVFAAGWAWPEFAEAAFVGLALACSAVCYGCSQLGLLQRPGGRPAGASGVCFFFSQTYAYVCMYICGVYFDQLWLATASFAEGVKVGGWEERVQQQRRQQEEKEKERRRAGCFNMLCKLAILAECRKASAESGRGGEGEWAGETEFSGRRWVGE